MEITIKLSASTELLAIILDHYHAVHGVLLPVQLHQEKTVLLNADELYNSAKADGNAQDFLDDVVSGIDNGRWFSRNGCLREE